MTYLHRMHSPVGPLTLLSDGDHLTGLLLPSHYDAAPVDAHEDAGPFATVIDQLQAYFAGKRRAFDAPLQPVGTPFQRRVWTALLDIPYGRTASYRDIAERIGSPTATRAVGMANGRNPIAIIIPCHRVIGANGSLTGYGGGLQCKRQLLDLEAYGPASLAPSEIKA